MPEQTKEEEHPDDPMMTRFEPVNVDDWSSRTVSALSPTNLTLLGNVQVAFIWMMDAGSKTVMGTEFDARIPENGLLLQFCDPPPPPPGAGAGTIPRASTIPPGGDSVVRRLSAAFSAAQKSKPVPLQLELPPLPQNAAASTNAPDPWIELPDAHTALSPSCAWTTLGTNIKIARIKQYAHCAPVIFISFFPLISNRWVLLPNHRDALLPSQKPLLSAKSKWPARVAILIQFLRGLSKALESLN